MKGTNLMKVKVDIREYLEEAADHNGDLHVAARFEPEELFEAVGIPEEEEIDVDLDELLAENRRIAHVWGTDDVRQLRPDLDDDQAWAVLQKVADRLDGALGITFETIETAAGELFPQPEGPWQGRIDVSVENYTRDAAVEHFEAMAAIIERQSVNSTMRAVFDPASLRLLIAND
jgi:hypothetical protein